MSQDSPAKHWIVVINNPTVPEIQEFRVFTHEDCDAYAWQIEQGEEKTPHIQARLSLKKKTRFTAMKKLFPRAHLEKGWSRTGGFTYCMKREGRIDGPWSFNVPEEVKIIDTLKDWQIDVMKIFDTPPDPRKIHWFWEEQGGTGKTVLCKYIVHEKNAIYVAGSAKDICYAVGNWKNKQDLIVLLDIPRVSMEYVSYQALENVKNGIFFMNKYESKMIMMNNPYVIVFANMPPDTSKLSQDRWDIRSIQ